MSGVLAEYVAISHTVNNKVEAIIIKFSVLCLASPVLLNSSDIATCVYSGLRNDVPKSKPKYFSQKASMKMACIGNQITDLSYTKQEW